MADEDVPPSVRRVVANGGTYSLNTQSEVIRTSRVVPNTSASYNIGPPRQSVDVHPEGVSANGNAGGVGAVAGAGASTAAADGLAAGGLPPIYVQADQSITITSGATHVDTDEFYSPTVTLEPLTAEATATVGPLPNRIVIIRTVLADQAAVQLAALSLLTTIELKIETLRATGSNSEIAEFDDLKRRVEEFLAASSKRDEAPIADTTLSIADGLRRFWTEKHVSICEKTLDMTLFGVGLAFCGAAGVLALPTALAVGALVGRKDVVETLREGAKYLPSKDKKKD